MSSGINLARFFDDEPRGPEETIVPLYDAIVDYTRMLQSMADSRDLDGEWEFPEARSAMLEEVERWKQMLQHLDDWGGCPELNYLIGTRKPGR